MINNALNTLDYPDIYKKYLDKEIELVINFVKNSQEVLDAGCGTGRAIPFIADNIKEYVGIDIDAGFLKEAIEIAKKFKNTRIIEQDVHTLSKAFEPGSFDKTIALWNSMACFKDDKKALREISNVTRNSLFFTLPIKGTIKTRKIFYDAVGADYRIDPETETVYSKEFGLTRAYSKEDIIELVEDTGFLIEKIGSIGNILHAIYLKKE